MPDCGARLPILGAPFSPSVGRVANPICQLRCHFTYNQPPPWRFSRYVVESRRVSRQGGFAKPTLQPRQHSQQQMSQTRAKVGGYVSACAMPLMGQLPYNSIHSAQYAQPWGAVYKHLIRKHLAIHSAQHARLWGANARSWGTIHHATSDCDHNNLQQPGQPGLQLQQLRSQHLQQQMIDSKVTRGICINSGRAGCRLKS